MHNQLRIARLELRNFKGVDAIELDAAGHDVAVYGDNATGKTTLADGFYWLLFDIDTAGRTDFEIKALDIEGEPAHNLEHEVTAELIEPGGVELELRKLFKEKWTKRRGEASKTFTGHTTDHFIDGVPVKKTEYDARVAELVGDAGLEGFKLLTDPAYFSERLHWQKRRQTLLEVCGDISDADIIAAGGDELAGLPDILGRRTLEDTAKVLKARRTDINRELTAIPTRVDEATRALPAAEGTPEDVAAELEAARAAETKRRGELAELESGGGAGKAAEESAKARAAIADLERELTTENAAALVAHDDAIRLRSAAVATIGLDVEKCRDAVKANDAAIATLTESRAELRAAWDSTDAGEPWTETDDYGDEHTIAAPPDFDEDETGPGVCSTCGQTLPAVHGREAHARAVEAHNIAKAERLEQLTAHGKHVADELVARDTKAPALQAALDGELEAFEGAKTSLETVTDARASAASESPTTNDAIDVARTTLEACEAAEQAAQGAVSGDVDNVRGEITGLEQEIAALQGRLAAFKAREDGEQRIEQLGDEERTLGTELEKLEADLFALEAFTRAKVSALEERINARFKFARFKLFRVLVNGALEECAETVFDGVPWPNLNHGARVQTGLDIIATLQHHYGTAPPVWIDQSESVTSLPALESQLVRLIVSADDSELRVVVGGTN